MVGNRCIVGSRLCSLLPSYLALAMSLNPDQLQELIDDLTGSCKSIAECMPTDLDESHLSQADHDEIDQQIFQCEECDWWFELSDEAEELKPGADQRLCKSCGGE